LVDLDSLLADDFEESMARRREALLHLIAEAMGKPLTVVATDEDVDEPVESPEDLEDL
jgi:hypothetical protein